MKRYINRKEAFVNPMERRDHLIVITNRDFDILIILKIDFLNFMTEIQIMSPESLDYGQHFVKKKPFLF